MTLLPLFIRGWKQLSAYNKGTNTKFCRWGRANVKRNTESVPCLFPLTTLLTEEQKDLANIQDLSYDFACRIVRLYQYLIDTHLIMRNKTANTLRSLLYPSKSIVREQVLEPILARRSMRSPKPISCRR